MAGCGNRNSDLKSERSQLQTEIKPLQTEVDSLQKDSNGLIHKDDTIYLLELEISQSHFTLNPKNL